MKDYQNLIKSLTLMEKAYMLCGYKTMETYPVDRLNIPPLVFSDGSSGLRKETEFGDSLVGISKSLPATAFPSPTNLGNTWDQELVKNVAGKIGKECKYYNVNSLLAPSVNIRRNPLCGRGFEYYSEDPILSGYLGASFIQGVEKESVGATVKHYACNNNEKYRFIGDSVVDERALREIYLKPFELAIKHGNPSCVMSSYNKVNGIHSSENPKLLKDILRNEWRFKGLTITDWGGIVNRDKALLNGTDLEMPGMTPHNINLLINGVKNGEIKEEVLDQSVERILKLIDKTSYQTSNCDFDEHFELALQVAEESAVLLENDGILPLNKKDKYLVIGDLFIKPRYQGSGSSLINPYKLSTHIDAFTKENIDFKFVKGYSDLETIPNEQLEQAVLNQIADFDKVIFYGGLTDFCESEGFDRTDLKLPLNQLSLLNKIIEKGKKIVLVLFGGNAVELPFKNQLNGILYMGLAGEAIGLATTNLLFGKKAPTGKLTITWPLSYDDVPNSKDFTKSRIEAYKESIYVGYRYFNTFKKQVLYPFGYGLNYTKFEYSNFDLKLTDKKIITKIKIKNIGKYKSKETIQIYIKKADSNINRPLKELKAFNKVELDINEEKEIMTVINLDDLKVFDALANKFVLEHGNYTVEAATNVNEVVGSKEIFLNGEKINEFKKFYLEMSDLDFLKNLKYQLKDSGANKPYTIETPIGEFNTFFGKIFKYFAVGIGTRQYRKALKMKDGLEKEREMKTGLFVSKMMPYNNLRSMCFSSSGKLKYNVARGILELVNGHFFKAIGWFLKKDKLKK